MRTNITLDSLSLEGSGIRNNAASALSNNKSIKYLDISYCDIDSSAIMDIAANMPSLIQLNASNNNIKTDGAIALSKNANIVDLNVGYNQINDIGAVALSHNKALVTLNVSSNDISDNGAAALAAIPSLTSLNLSSNKIQDKGAFALAATTTIKNLDVSYNWIDNAGMTALISNQTLISFLLKETRARVVAKENSGIGGHIFA